MGSSPFRLDSPSQHSLIFNAMNEVHPQPISGTVTLDGFDQVQFAGSNLLHVCLIGVISCTDQNTRGSKSHGCWLKRLCPWFLAKHEVCQLGARLTRSCSVIEQLTIYQPFANDKEHAAHIIPFCLPIDNSLPGTSFTDVGTISYYLLATLQTADGKPLHATSRDINITHHICPEKASIQHIKDYSGRNLITKIIMTQNLGSTTRARIPITAKVFVRPARPADRMTEYRCIAIRGIRWRVEEIAGIIKVSNDQKDNGWDAKFVESKSSSRVISKGLQKGYWKIPQGNRKEENFPQIQSSSADIPLEISLKRGITTPSEVDPNAYNSFYKSNHSLNHLLSHETTFPTTQENLMIAIKHQLKLDILTSEDTFCIHKHTLVDRRPLPTALDASFPLQIIEKPSKDMRALLEDIRPPQYREISLSAPQYTESESSQCVV
ncbi:hypothetical protein PENSTE_c005G03546 [Penicillium steckii]|uniref:LDB19 N-terminal domain-containing protein n=1 Tax=Penicillium steckii TaxID=303698 RepID=A0A1V6TL20_9EURO|nr:hypothetical protein PENSTE_c005G03546 [Penicillium steckii]